MSLNDKTSPSYVDGQEIQKSETEAKTEEPSQDMQKSDVENSQNIEALENKESGTDRELYEKILEKLDIKPKEKGQDIQVDSIQKRLQQETILEKSQIDSQIRGQVEKAISQDFNKIQHLMKTGLINSAQEQNLKKQVLKKAFDKLVQTEKIKRTLPSSSMQNNQEKETLDKQINRANVFDDFSKSNPNFFTSDGRKEVLNYLKSDNISIGKDELNQISNIIRTVEKAAIDRYLQKAAHEKTLKNSNESAKQRLTANAQNSGFSANLSRTFTREQIGKMNSAEFAKYEPAIMEQLKKGHIK